VAREAAGRGYPFMKRTLPFHPLCFTFFFIAAPLVDNLNEMQPALMVRFYLAALLADGVFIGAVWLVTRNVQQGAFLCSMMWIAVGLTSFPYLTNIGVNLIPVKAAVFILLALCLALLFLFGRRGFWRSIRNPSRITFFLNVIGVISISYSMYMMVNYTVQLERWKSDQARWVRENLSAESAAAADDPDIYYVILDGYGREDVLRDLYGVENESFLDELRNDGFFIAEDGSSNYIQTILSVSSSLNLNYLDGPIREWGADSTDRKMPAEMIQHSLARAFLERRGYRTVNITSGFFPTEIRDADERWGADTPLGLNVFEQFWILYSPFQTLIPADEFGRPAWGYAAHRERIVEGFEELARVSEEPGPKFVFAHILAPHPPFVLAADGTPVEPDRPYRINDGDHYQGSMGEYLAGYAGQVRYVNSRLLEVIPEILQNASRPVVIILQGDHGPGSRLSWTSAEESCLWERTSILNAYYLPEEYRAALYPSITPVNTFRLVFREMFGAGYPPLEDARYYSTWYAPYRMQRVSGEITDACL
jgi:hypothetical protein